MEYPPSARNPAGIAVQGIEIGLVATAWAQVRSDMVPGTDVVTIADGEESPAVVRGCSGSADL